MKKKPTNLTNLNNLNSSLSKKDLKMLSKNKNLEKQKKSKSKSKNININSNQNVNIINNNKNKNITKSKPKPKSKLKNIINKNVISKLQFNLNKNKIVKPIIKDILDKKLPISNVNINSNNNNNKLTINNNKHFFKIQGFSFMAGKNNIVELYTILYKSLQSLLYNKQISEDHNYNNKKQKYVTVNLAINLFISEFIKINQIVGKEKELNIIKKKIKKIVFKSNSQTKNSINLKKNVLNFYLHNDLNNNNYTNLTFKKYSNIINKSGPELIQFYFNNLTENQKQKQTKNFFSWLTIFKENLILLNKHLIFNDLKLHTIKYNSKLVNKYFVFRDLKLKTNNANYKINDVTKYLKIDDFINSNLLNEIIKDKSSVFSSNLLKKIKWVTNIIFNNKNLNLKNKLIKKYKLVSKLNIKLIKEYQKLISFNLTMNLKKIYYYQLKSVEKKFLLKF